MRSDSPERGAGRGGAAGRLQPSGTVALRIDEREQSGTDAADGDLDDELLYWRARAKELEEQLAAMRARLLALADHLPPSLAPLLGSDTSALARSYEGSDPLADWEETTLLKPASVAHELGRLWEKIRRTRAQ
jgi:hypothetical protein